MFLCETAKAATGDVCRKPSGVLHTARKTCNSTRAETLPGRLRLVTDRENSDRDTGLRDWATASVTSCFSGWGWGLMYGLYPGGKGHRRWMLRNAAVAIVEEQQKQQCRRTHIVPCAWECFPCGYSIITHFLYPYSTWHFYGDGCQLVLAVSVPLIMRNCYPWLCSLCSSSHWKGKKFSVQVADLETWTQLGNLSMSGQSSIWSTYASAKQSLKKLKSIVSQWSRPDKTIHAAFQERSHLNFMYCHLIALPAQHIYY